MFYVVNKQFDSPDLWLCTTIIISIGEADADHRSFLQDVIKMYFSQSEHGVPHFHAVQGEFNSVFSIETVEMIEVDLPLRSQKLVKEWGTLYRSELLRMWQNNEFKQLPGLE